HDLKSIGSNPCAALQTDREGVVTDSISMQRGNAVRPLLEMDLPGKPGTGTRQTLTGKVIVSDLCRMKDQSQGGQTHGHHTIRRVVLHLPGAAILDHGQ